ncbi:ABC transporter ATP-binding protein [Ferrovibrio sp.]|uniref:ABC transporter ATP-binding protein n=1 Tax=Ferrovibrio sp. TaxID=1917215 RepID=UPI003D0CCF31
MHATAPGSQVQGQLHGQREAGHALTLDAITHRFGAAKAVDDVTLEIGGSELVALLGPSGCGKTTLLRIIAGFINQSQGRVIIGGSAIDHLPPSRREVGIVFQNYALFPHLTVAENIAYGLAARGLPKPEQETRVAEMLALVQMGHLAARYPKQMSGGQQQRVALARALAVRPRILLLDEPFSALDKNLRLDMQIEIKRIQQRAGITAILVTHDQEEALSMADRIAVLAQGRLEQFGSPSAVYDTPQSLFVNTFVGTANKLAGKLMGIQGSEARVSLAAGGEMILAAPKTEIVSGADVVICIRPENLRFVEGAAPLTGSVELGLPLGATIVHEIRLPDGSGLKISEPRSSGAEPRPSGQAVALAPINTATVTLFPAL